MIGIIIVTHGNLALELKSAMEHILGVQRNIEIISIKPDDDLEIKKSSLEESIKRVNEDNGTIILTDMFGSTPSNIAKEFSHMKKVNVVSGINLSMLLNIFNYPSLSLQKITAKALEGGKDGVIQINYERKKNSNK